MLTSERKLCKLFIKFLEWDKIKKAEFLVQTYPNLQMPWQKAFEIAGLNNSFIACKWIYDNTKVPLDIHFKADALILNLVTRGFTDFIKWLVMLEPIYSWKNKVESNKDGTSSKIREDVLQLLDL
jgi:hypothetical protein